MEGILNAIRDNEFNVLVDILSAQPDIDLNTWDYATIDEWGKFYSLQNPLHLAALKCNLEAIEYLLSHGADINIKDADGGGVLDDLVCNDYIDSRLPIIEFLVRKGADIGPESFKMALNCIPEVVQIYIKTYSKDVVMDTRCRIMAFDKQKEFEIIEYFIGAPDFVLEENVYEDEDTVGFLEYTQKLLSKFIEKKSWENALRFILVHSYSNIFNSVGGYVDEKVKIIETIMENLTDFSYVDPNGTKFVDEIFRKCVTPELFMRLDENIGKKLLEARANKIVLTEALMSYLRKGKYGEAEMNIVKKYVEAGVGVDLNLPSSTYSSCPIHTACQNQTREVIEFLVDHGADINIKDEHPRNALDYLVMVDKGRLDFSLIESFVARGADIEGAFYFAFEHDKEILRCLMRTRNKDMALKPLERSRCNNIDENGDDHWETWELDIRYYVTLTIERELDFDILEYIIGAPDLVFQDFSMNTSSAKALQYTYKMLNQCMENKSWENALRLILVYLYSFDLTIDNHYSFGGLEDNKIGIFETIMENQIDFSYVDPHGTKFIDVIFKKYLELELFKQIDENVGKKLLEAGAERKILNEALNKYLDLDEFDIHIVKKYIEVGVDLNMSFDHNGEEIPLCDAVYMVSALHGHFKLVEEMIAKGANLDCILLSKEIEQMLTNDPFHEDRVKFVVDKLIAGGILKDKNTKMGPRGESFVDFFAYHHREIVLVKCGLFK